VVLVSKEVMTKSKLILPLQHKLFKLQLQPKMFQLKLRLKLQLLLKM
jgi:hypothetical protein